MSHRMDALVTDADGRTGLYAIRSIGGKRNIVGAISPTKSAIGFLSRYCKYKYVGDYNIILERLGEYNVVVPVSIPAIKFVLAHKREIESCANLPPLPSLKSFNQALDKSKLMKLADKLNIPRPRTFLPDEISKNDFPLFIKYRIETGIAPKDRHAIVRDIKEFNKIYNDMGKIQEKPLIQEYIEGGGYGFFALYNYDSELRAIFCHKRLREAYPDGGPSTFCMGDYIPQIIEYGKKLFNSLEWKGLGMVEFKKDVRTGEYKLMEINPRIWGSMPLAIVSGVDFPYLWYKIATDKDIEAIERYNNGVKLRFLSSDIYSLCSHFKAKDNKIGFLNQFIRSYLDLQVRYGILSKDDPLPALMDMVPWKIRNLRQK